MNLRRVWVVATNVFREVIRDRILFLLGFFALLLVLALRALPELSAGTWQKIILDFGLASMSVLALVVTVFIGTGLVNKEIEKRTVFVLIAKPVSRAEFIIGKHLGLSAVLAVLLALMTGLYLALLGFSRVPFPLVGILMSVLYLFLEMSLLTAVAIGFGVFTSSLLATLLTFAVYLMGHFSRDVVLLGNLTQNPNIVAITKALYLVLPDLARLNLKNQAVYGILPDPTTLLANAGYGVLYTVVLLSIAVLIFSLREF